MVYAGDQWVQLPTRDLYDSQMMAIAINTAKDMYEKRQQEMKDFRDLYKDFYSPVPGRTQEMYDETIGKLKNTVDAIYAAGGDPLRSPEAGAIINKAINDINIAKVNNIRKEAATATEYIKNRTKAIMDGTYDENVERAVRGQLLEDWSPENGEWTATAPVKYISKEDIISPLARQLTPEFDAIRTAQENDGYDYKTVSEDRIRKMVDDNIDDLINGSDIGRYYYNQALQQTGQNKDLAKRLLAEQYAQIAKKYTKDDRELNQYKYQKMLSDERRKAARESAWLSYHYDKLLHPTRPNDGYPNIFDRADEKPGEMVGFVPGTEYSNKIDSYNDKAVYDGGGYVISQKDISSIVNRGDILSEDGRPFVKGTFDTKKGLYAVPASGLIRKNLIRKNSKTGKFETVKDKYAYYMRVQLQAPSVIEEDGKYKIAVDDNGNYIYKQVDSKNGNGYALMRVKERDANYGKQQEKDRSVNTTD